MQAAQCEYDPRIKRKLDEINALKEEMKRTRAPYRKQIILSEIRATARAIEALRAIR